MATDRTAGLVEALRCHERRYVAALDELRAAASPERENETAERVLELREAVELVRCLRRLVEGRTALEIHRAFGAPGAFGHHTEIGAALAALYSAAAKEGA